MCMFRCACARFVGEQIQMDVCIGTCTFRVRVEEQLTRTIQCAPTNDDLMRAGGSTVSCKREPVHVGSGRDRLL
jgi:hypothetical protein